MEFICEAKVISRGGLPEIEYRLLRSERELFGTMTSVYSILCISQSSDGLSDEVFLYDVSSDHDTAAAIFRAITEGEVTPVSVADFLVM